jgi:hypothetical protein
MQLRGGAKDKSGWSMRVSGVMVCAGCVGCQGPVGRMGTEGERGGERGVDSRLGCVSGCSQHWFTSVGLASACVLCPYFTCRCLGQDPMNVSRENDRDPVKVQPGGGRSGKCRRMRDDWRRSEPGPG